MDAQKETKLVLEDKQGRIIRSFYWETDQATVIRRRDSRRLEVHADIHKLIAQNIPFEIVQKIHRSQLDKGPVECSPLGQIAWENKGNQLYFIDTLNSSRDSIFNEWWGLVVALLLFVPMVIVGHFLPSRAKNVKNQSEELVVHLETKKDSLVKVLQPKHLHPVRVFPREGKGSFHSENGNEMSEGPTNQKSAHTGGGIKRRGVLGVFGSLHQGRKQWGGINLGELKTSAGPGLGGGSGSSGGVQTQIYANGISSAPLGGGGNLYGSGGTGTGSVGSSSGKGGGQAGVGEVRLYGSQGDGTSNYGTRGKGGGQENYGSHSIQGSGLGSSLALNRESRVEGGLDSEMISAVIQKNMGQVRFCYEQGLQGNPQLMGRVAIGFIIGMNGQVKKADIDHSSLNSDLVESCILGRLKAWQFPVPEGGVEVKVSYPFLLRRVGRG